MKILGIIMSTGSTAALMIDGEIVATASEERFSRVKNDERYPKLAIEYVIRQGGINAGDIDLVAFAGQIWDPRYFLVRHYSKWSVKDRLKEQQEYWYPRMYLGKEPDYYELFKDKLDFDQFPGNWDKVMEFERLSTSKNSVSFYQKFRQQMVAQHLGIDENKVKFIHHHRAHAYYAYYASDLPKERTLILTADAWGDDMNASVSIAQGGRIERISSSTNFMIARLYRSMTLLLGMKPDEHEYKVMGLAAYSKPEYYKEPLEVFSQTQYVEGLGFNYHKTPPDLYVYFRDKFEGMRFDNIAGALQEFTDQIVAQWAKNCLRTTATSRLVFGGGMGMNIKASMEIAKLQELDDMLVCPSPSDESLAAGACYAAMYEYCHETSLNPDEVLRPFTNAYLGPEVVDEKETAVIAQRDGYKVTSNPSLSHIANAIANGQILGRCVGRSEFGARSLGNRSLIADARNLNSVRVLNEKIKSRDFWMPFAPTILKERSSDYLENPKGLRSPYMTLAFETKELARTHLRAALHQADLTCRPQVLDRKANPDYHNLIQEFQNVTGVGGVLNTSFNLHGEPIVQTAREAYEIFKARTLDMLLLENVLIEQAAHS